MARAKANVRFSTCISHPLGTFLRCADGRVLDGWNGLPGGLTCKQMFGGCPRKAAGAKSGERMELCSAVHAERRPLLNAAALGIKIAGGTLYAWCGIPCKDCMVELIQAGIMRIVCLDDDKFNRKTPSVYNFELSARLAKEARIIIDLLNERELEEQI